MGALQQPMVRSWSRYSNQERIRRSSSLCNRVILHVFSCQIFLVRPVLHPRLADATWPWPKMYAVSGYWIARDVASGAFSFRLHHLLRTHIVWLSEL